MAATAEPDVVQAQLEEVTPYSMHVSHLSFSLRLTKPVTCVCFCSDTNGREPRSPLVISN
jgi:hypothetical protein